MDVNSEQKYEPLKGNSTRQRHSLIRTIHQNIDTQKNNGKKYDKEIFISNYSSGGMVYNFDRNPQMNATLIKSPLNRKQQRKESPFIRTICQNTTAQSNGKKQKIPSVSKLLTGDIATQNRIIGFRPQVVSQNSSDKSDFEVDCQNKIQPISFASPKLTRKTLQVHTSRIKEQLKNDQSNQLMNSYCKDFERNPRTVYNNENHASFCYEDCSNSSGKERNIYHEKHSAALECERNSETCVNIATTEITRDISADVRNGVVNNAKGDNRIIHKTIKSDRDERQTLLTEYSPKPRPILVSDGFKDSFADYANKNELKRNKTESGSKELNMEDPVSQNFGSASAILARVKRLKLKYNFKTSMDLQAESESNDVEKSLLQPSSNESIHHEDENSWENESNIKREKRRHFGNSCEDLRQSSNFIVFGQHYSSDEDIRYKNTKHTSYQNGIQAKEEGNMFLNSSDSLLRSTTSRKDEKSAAISDQGHDAKLIHENKSNCCKEIVLDREKIADNPALPSQQDTIQFQCAGQSIQSETNCGGAPESLHDHNRDHMVEGVSIQNSTEKKDGTEINLNDEKGIDVTQTKGVSTLKRQFEKIHAKQNHILKHNNSCSSSSSSEDEMKMFKFGALKSMFEQSDDKNELSENNGMNEVLQEGGKLELGNQSVNEEMLKLDVGRLQEKRTKDIPEVLFKIKQLKVVPATKLFQSKVVLKTEQGNFTVDDKERKKDPKEDHISSKQRMAFDDCDYLVANAQPFTIDLKTSEKSSGIVKSKTYEDEEYLKENIFAFEAKETGSGENCDEKISEDVETFDKLQNSDEVFCEINRSRKDCENVRISDISEDFDVLTAMDAYLDSFDVDDSATQHLLNQCNELSDNEILKYSNVPDVNLPALLTKDESCELGSMHQDQMHYGPYISYSRKATDMKIHATELGLYNTGFDDKKQVKTTDKIRSKKKPEKTKGLDRKIISRMKLNPSLSINILPGGNGANTTTMEDTYNFKSDGVLFTQAQSKFTNSLFEHNNYKYDDDHGGNDEEQHVDSIISQPEEKETDVLKKDEVYSVNINLRLTTANKKQQELLLGVARVNKMEELEDVALDMFMKYLKRIDKESLEIERSDMKFVGIRNDLQSKVTGKISEQNIDYDTSTKEDICFVEFEGGNEFSLAQFSFETLIQKYTLKEYMSILMDERSLVFIGPNGIGKTYFARTMAALLNKRLIKDNKISSAELNFYSNVDPVKWSEIVKVVECKERIESPTIVVIDGLDLNLSWMENLESFLSKPRENVYIIATCSTSRNLNANVLLRSSASSLDFNETMSQVVNWLNNVWQKVNNLVENCAKLSEMIGPAVFFSLPNRKDEIEEWFIDLWNYSLLPYLQKTINNSYRTSHINANSFDLRNWIVQTYPWKNERDNLFAKLRQLKLKNLAEHCNQQKVKSMPVVIANPELMRYLSRLQKCLDLDANVMERVGGKEHRRTYLESTL
eukprot:gene16690-18384_t